MSDLISRCELFNRLANVQTLGDAYSVIQGMPTIEQLHWIPCSERLPEPETEVLVSFDNGTVEKLWQKWTDPLSVNDGNYPGEPLAYIGGDEFPVTEEDWARLKTYVIAWMPLPEAYTEGEG